MNRQQRRKAERDRQKRQEQQYEQRRRLPISDDAKVRSDAERLTHEFGEVMERMGYVSTEALFTAFGNLAAWFIDDLASKIGRQEKSNLLYWGRDIFFYVFENTSRQLDEEARAASN